MRRAAVPAVCVPPSATPLAPAVADPSDASLPAVRSAALPHTAPGEPLAAPADALILKHTHNTK